MMKKLICFALTMVILLGVALVPASAVSYPIVDVYVSGQKIEAYQSAFIMDGRTMVPLRAICEALKCKVDWNPSTRTAQIQNELTIISVQIDNYKITRVERANPSNVEIIEIDVPPMIFNNSTMVPARAVSEALHAKVEWDGQRRRVDVWLEYDSIEEFVDGVAIITLNGKKGLVNEQGRIIFAPICESIEGFVDGVAINSMNVNGSIRYGAINTSAEIVIPATYRKIERVNKLFIVTDEYGRSGILDISGKTVIPVDCDSIYIETYNKTNYFIISRNYKEGLYSADGEQIIPAEYDSIEYIDGYFKVRRDGLYGVYNKSGKSVIRSSYDSLYSYASFFIVGEDGRYGAYAADGSLALPIIYKNPYEVERAIVEMIR